MSEHMTTDVLIVGGSIAGLAAAITAKEQDPALDVTVVEKYTSGYSGKANRGAGILLVLGDSEPEEFAQFYLKHIGLYLNNQTMLLKYASMLERQCRGHREVVRQDRQGRERQVPNAQVGLDANRPQRGRESPLRSERALSLDSGGDRLRLCPPGAQLRSQERA